MPLLPEPLFYQTIKREDGAKRKLLFIVNNEDAALSLEVSGIEKPEWVEIEEFLPGKKIDFPGGGKRTRVIANLNTNHRFFPHGKSMDEKVKVSFADGTTMEIPITIQSIVEGIEDFRGVFAMDFGTTNTCFAYKGKFDEYQDAITAQETKSSPEIPSLIFFKDVSSKTNPKYLVGNLAKQEIQEFGWQTYSYFMSVKRLLGQDRTVVVMDEHATEGEGHRQEWSTEDIASFIVRDIITRAQKDLGQRITKVVATFPILFTVDRKEALTRVFKRALQDLGIEPKDDTVVLDVDETNAAAFNYIYGTMINEIRGIAVREKKATILSYDFGGGTVDVSLIDLAITRDQVGRINVTTDVKGLTGDRYLGGDNVTLDVVKALKKKAALIAAEKLLAGIAAEREKASQAKEQEEDIFSFKPKKGKGKKKDEDEDMFKAEEEEKPAAQQAAVVEEDPDTAEIVNRDEKAEYLAAAELVAKHKDVLQKAIAEGRTVAQAYYDWEEEKGGRAARDQSQLKAEALDQAVERLVPTRYADYENVDPDKSEVARRLFLELWAEADVLKIRLSNTQLGKERVASQFKRVAKYTGVDRIVFTEIDMSVKELEAAVEPKVRESVAKAYKLYLSTLTQTVGGGGGGGGLEIVGASGSGLQIVGGNVSIDAGKPQSDRELRILLAGNGARLPLIKRVFMEIFGVDDSRIVMDKGQMKTGVARGAAEEYYLRKAFGRKGIITYNPSHFLEKIPYTIGLYQKDLELIGFEGGFCPIFARGTKVGSSTVLSERTNPLIYKDIQQLTLFADYHDGANPYYLGWFDFTKPAEGGEEPPKAEEPKAGEAKPEEPQPEATPAEGEAGEGEYHKIEIRLLPNRQPEAKDPKTGQRFAFFPRKEVWKPEENPFSGVH